MKGQPKWELLDSALVFYTGLVFMVLGSIFVLSSFYTLGFTGTFLGKSSVYGFPPGSSVFFQHQQAFFAGRETPPPALALFAVRSLSHAPFAALINRSSFFITLIYFLNLQMNV